ncbi:MAG: hypothetical protein ABH950_06510 [Candidatus Altiarchaeota archaeon]
MKRTVGLVIIIVIALVTACDTVPSTGSDNDQFAQIIIPEETIDANDPYMLIERAKALQYNEGKLEEAEKIYKQILKDKKTETELRAVAVLNLSDISRSQGNKEKAITLIEDFLYTEATDSPGVNIPKKRELKKKLRNLVLGENEDKKEDDSLPPIDYSNAIIDIAQNVPCSGELLILSMGQQTARDIFMQKISHASNQLCQEADKRQKKRTDKEVKLSRSVSHWGSDWTMIPERRDQMNIAITVFFHDPLSHPIPKRYAQYLPMDYDEMKNHLAANQGLITYTMRNGLPNILVAAPDQTKMYRLVQKLLTEDRFPEDKIYIVNF